MGFINPRSLVRFQSSPPSCAFILLLKCLCGFSLYISYNPDGERCGGVMFFRKMGWIFSWPFGAAGISGAMCDIDPRFIVGAVIGVVVRHLLIPAYAGITPEFWQIAAICWAIESIIILLLPRPEDDYLLCIFEAALAGCFWGSLIG